MKKTALIAIAIITCNISYAGFNGVTHHSRANCGNNESISWDWQNDWYFWVNSEHIDTRTGTIVHAIVEKWQKTWRRAAVHWGEGTHGWTVHGSHYMLASNGKPLLMADEYVEDCSIYDGWWDKNK